MSTTVIQKLGTCEVSFENTITQINFEPFILDVIEELNNKLDAKLQKVWIDVGTSGIYDLHIEVIDNQSNINEDLYFVIKEDNLLGTSVSKGINLKKNFDEVIVDKMIISIKEVQKLHEVLETSA